MNLTPLHDNLVVKPRDSEEKSPGGIVLPDASKEKLHIGDVIAAGPGRRTADGTLIETTVKPKQAVAWGKFDGQALRLDGVDLIVISESQIFGIIEGL